MSSVVASELGTLPQDWRVDRFDSLFSVQQGKQVSKKNREGNSQRPFLRTKNVFWGRLDLSELDEMHFTDGEESRLALQPGDLLICEGGDIGRTAIWRGDLQRCYHQNHLHRARRRNCAEVDPEFVLFWLWYAFEVGSVYFGRGNVTTIPNLSQSKLCELPLPVPPLAEQRKIAAVLGLVQRAIEQQERLIALTTELKKTLLHKLFTEGLRGEPQKQTEIGPVPESWDVSTLENAALAFDYGTSVKCEHVKAGVPVLRIPNVVGGSIDLSDLKHGQPKRSQLDHLRLQHSDLLFVRTNGVLENAGRCALYRGELENCYFASYLIRVRVDSSKVLPAFVNEYARTERGRSFMSGRAIRTADGKFNINAGTLKRVLLPLPSLDEQTEIVRRLDLVERKLELHETKRVRLIDLFRTLLHQLMTAQIRAHDLDLDEILRQPVAEIGDGVVPSDGPAG
jgi:type I restriction enzyme S subunit